MDEEYGWDDMDEVDIEMSMCEDCQITGATVHLTHVERNEAMTYHLCEECARKRGVPIPDGETLLRGLEAMVANAAAAALAEKQQQVKVIAKPQVIQKPKEEEEVDVKCPKCAMMLSDFRKGGRLGCVACYESFADQIEKVHSQVHGAYGHKGKKYANAGAPASKSDMERLQRELKDAIANEHFELAATIRDTIRRVSNINVASVS